ncbi:MAG: hypothetical protein K6T83_19305 [Alicyclobacillus sp.]|nr:hypothetical protein [Alicyclobacillus sp.]
MASAITFAGLLLSIPSIDAGTRPSNGTSAKSLSVGLKDFRDIHMFTPKLGVGITVKGTIEQTTDGGMTWDNTTPIGFRVVDIADYMKATQYSAVAWFVAIDSHNKPVLLMTPNGGSSFHELSLPSAISINEIRTLTFITGNVGYIVTEKAGKSAVLYKTSNGAWTWTRIQ